MKCIAFKYQFSFIRTLSATYHLNKHEIDKIVNDLTLKYNNVVNDVVNDVLRSSGAFEDVIQSVFSYVNFYSIIL
jgi:uncharacterized protein YutD